MRLEVGDLGASTARVFLDGVEQHGVVCADSTLNFIRRYKRLDGKLVKDARGDLVIETVFGSVVIELEVA